MEYKVGDVIRVEGCSSMWDGEYTITEIENAYRYTLEPPVDSWTGFTIRSRVDNHSKLISRVGCKYKVGDVIEVNRCNDSWDGLHEIEELHSPHGNIVYYKTNRHVSKNGFSEDSLVGECSKLYEPLDSIKPLGREKLLSLVRQLNKLESDVWEIIGDQSWDF